MCLGDGWAMTTSVWSTGGASVTTEVLTTGVADATVTPTGYATTVDGVVVVVVVTI